LNHKHLIVPTQYYDPETFQVNNLVSLFLAKGWHVTVIAPVPSYPSSSELRGTAPVFQHSRLRICRFLTIKRNGSLFSAILNSIIFVLLGSTITIFHALRYPKSHIFAVQYSPFTCIVPACIAGFLLGRSASLWIFDLWPQSISALINTSCLSRYAFWFIEPLVLAVYSPFTNFFVSSPSFVGLPPVSRLKGVDVLYSWEPNHVLPRLGCGDTADLADAIRVISIGNLGAAHDLDLLEEFLLFTKSQNFAWSFVGGGSGMSRLQAFCTSHQLTHVDFHGFLPKADCLRLCSLADLSIVPFRDSEVSDTICYRFVSSLSVATPVISFGDNAVSELVRSCSCGFILDRSNSPNFQAARDGSVSESLSMLVDVIHARLIYIRSSFRESALALFESRFSETAAEASLQRFFVDI
jgi:glycosyltransferase involved in cell wall biosynthesis